VHSIARQKITKIASLFIGLLVYFSVTFRLCDLGVLNWPKNKQVNQKGGQTAI